MNLAPQNLNGKIKEAKDILAAIELGPSKKAELEKNANDTLEKIKLVENDREKVETILASSLANKEYSNLFNKYQASSSLGPMDKEVENEGVSGLIENTFMTKKQKMDKLLTDHQRVCAELSKAIKVHQDRLDKTLKLRTEALEGSYETAFLTKLLEKYASNRPQLNEPLAKLKLNAQSLWTTLELVENRIKIDTSIISQGATTLNLRIGNFRPIEENKSNYQV